MSVVAGTIGRALRFGEELSPQDASDDHRPAIPLNDLRPNLSSETVSLATAAVVVNSTAMETSVAGEFIGSSTESSLLRFAQEGLGMGPVSIERDAADIVHMIPFDSRRKWMAVVLRLGPSRYRLLVKGGAEVIIAKCSTILSDPQNGLAQATLLPEDVTNLSAIVSQFAEERLRVVAAGYKNFDTWEGGDDNSGALSETALAGLVSDLTFIGSFGIRDPLRPNVALSVRQCQSAGVFVRIVTGDNFLTAKSIASEACIYTPGGIAIDGPTFRHLTDDQLSLVAWRIQVLARSSPEDKKRLVAHLKSLGEIVAVTGDGTNDALALKTADIGFSMGVSGTEVAKEASDIILMDDNFASIVKAISWGRAVNDATKKFLQASKCPSHRRDEK